MYRSGLSFFLGSRRQFRHHSFIILCHNRLCFIICRTVSGNRSGVCLRRCALLGGGRCIFFLPGVVGGGFSHFRGVKVCLVLGVMGHYTDRLCHTGDSKRRSNYFLFFIISLPSVFLLNIRFYAQKPTIFSIFCIMRSCQGDGKRERGKHFSEHMDPEFSIAGKKYIRFSIIIPILPEVQVDIGQE